MLLQMILKLCSVDFANTDAFFEMFGFRETEAFQTKVDFGLEHSRYDDAGYQSSIFFELLGPLLITVIVYTVIVVVIKLLQKLRNATKTTRFTRLANIKMQHGLVGLRFLLEGCIEIGMSALICIIMMEEESFDHFWEAVSTLCAFVSIILLVLAPIFLLVIIVKYLKLRRKERK